MDRCPVCRAKLKETPVCRRCGCDLTVAEACRQQAESRLRQALHLLRRGESLRARSLADEARSLDSSEVVRSLAAFIHWWDDRHRGR